MKTVCISGGFDPAHIGHIDHIEDAANYGEVIVILNSDEWLKRKKGYAFMPFEERARILKALRCVKDVVAVDDADGTVCEALRRIKPDFYAKGGDRTADNTPEAALCKELGIGLIWNVGGGKTQASSALVRNALSSLTPKPTPCQYEDKP